MGCSDLLAGPHVIGQGIGGIGGMGRWRGELIRCPLWSLCHRIVACGDSTAHAPTARSGSRLWGPEAARQNPTPEAAAHGPLRTLGDGLRGPALSATFLSAYCGNRDEAVGVSCGAPANKMRSQAVAQNASFRQRHLEEGVRAEIVVGRRSEQREKLRRRYVIGPQQVEGVAFDVVLRIRSALAGRQRADEAWNAGVAAMFERRHGSRPDLGVSAALSATWRSSSCNSVSLHFSAIRSARRWVMAPR